MTWGLTFAHLLDVALKTALVSATLFVPGTDPVTPGSRCAIEASPVGTTSHLIAWGDSLGRIMTNAGANREEVSQVRRAVRRHHNLNTLSVGDRLDIHVRDDGVVSWFRYRPHLTTAICARRTLRGAFSVRREELEAQTEIAVVDAAVETTFAAAIDSAGEEASLTLLYETLFPPGITRGESDEDARLTIVVEKRTIEGDLLDYGRVLAAEYHAKHKQQRVFHHEWKDGTTGYYDEDGIPRQSTRLRSPVPGAPIASPYGYRDHPIRKRRRMHRGLDYSAARGASVSAAADGVVVSAKWEGPLGRLVAIRHRGGLVTHYAHLDGFSKRAKRGARIRQGQVIGYVGSTGLSTGAHLHFETLVDGKYMNPLRLQSAAAPALTDFETDRFSETVVRLLRLLNPAGQVGSDA